MTRSTAVKRDLATLLRARCSLIWLTTPEEETAEAGVIEGAAMARYNPEDLRIWDCAAGLQDIRGRVLTRDTSGLDGSTILAPEELFRVIREDTNRRVYIARDLHDWMDPISRRHLRTLARQLARTRPDEARNLIVISPSGDIPPELRDHVVVIEWPLPDREEVGQILDQSIARLPESDRQALDLNGNRSKAVDAALGLTAQGVARCFSRSLVSTRGIDPALIQAEKRRVVSASGLLTWYEPEPRGLDAIGGLDRLKRDLVSLGGILGQDARDFGLPAPKGIVLAGAPGCGKSLACKCVPNLYGVPLIRIDMGSLQSKYVGESQQNLRAAFQLARTVSPCVLWLDEIDKALAGATGPAGDGGVASDAIGTLLTEKQECLAPVFWVATCNDPIGLTKSFPELFRAGRWDGVYWIDLPQPGERHAILATTLEARGRNPETLDLWTLEAVTDGFSGAELAATVDKAVMACFLDGKRPLTLEDLHTAAAGIVPLSRSAAESLREVRDWARGRAIPASDPEGRDTDTATNGGLDIS